MIYKRTDASIDNVILAIFLSLYYIKEIDFRLPYICSAIDHRRQSLRYEAHGKFGEHKRCIRVALRVAESNSY